MASPAHPPHRTIVVRRAVALRGTAVTLLLTTLAALGVMGTVSPAHAEDGYRYWAYFQQTGQGWTASQKGAGEVVPEDGSVEGYRYGASTMKENVQPRTDPAEVTFAAICGAAQAAAGEKRVAVVIDYGTAADAEGDTPPQPRAECAVVPEDATGQQVLEAVAKVRSGAIPTCAIDGYPAQGCGEPVTDVQVPADEQPVAFELPASGEDAQPAASDTAESSEEAGSGPWLLVAVVVVVLLLAAAALVLSRRRSGSNAA